MRYKRLKNKEIIKKWIQGTMYQAMELDSYHIEKRNLVSIEEGWIRFKLRDNIIEVNIHCKNDCRSCLNGVFLIKEGQKEEIGSYGLKTILERMGLL